MSPDGAADAARRGLVGGRSAARPERETRGAPRYDRAAGFVHGFFVAALERTLSSNFLYFTT